MTTFDFKGYIKFDDYGDYETIYLTDSGLRINLVSRMEEIRQSYDSCIFQINYWTSKTEITKDEAIKRMLIHAFGGHLDVGFEDNGFMGSSWTGYCPMHDTILQIGGHSLLRELRDKEGEYLIIEINVMKLNEKH